MREVEVPLLCFGPPRLRAWLHEHWDELSDASRTALSQLVSRPASQSGQAPRELRNLAANLDYEHILSALSDQDFRRFSAAGRRGQR